MISGSVWTRSISGYGVTGFAGLTIEISGSDTVIDLDNTAADVNEVTVRFRTNLTAADFIFA
jgi:hypothetical protein